MSTVINNYAGATVVVNNFTLTPEELKKYQELLAQQALLQPPHQQAPQQDPSDEGEDLEESESFQKAKSSTFPRPIRRIRVKERYEQGFPYSGNPPTDAELRDLRVIKRSPTVLEAEDGVYFRQKAHHPDFLKSKFECSSA